MMYDDDDETESTKEVTINDVMRLASSAMDAKNSHDRARDKYEGYSWGWHGAALIGEQERTMKEFGEALDSYIDQRITARLAQISVGRVV